MRIFLFTLSCLLAPLAAHAEVVGGAGDQLVVTAAQLADWLNDLQSDDFVKRQAASASLEKAGVPAIEGLQAVAEAGNVDAATRAIKVLARMANDQQEAVATAAKESLKALSASQQPVIAQQAKQALSQQEAPGGLPQFPVMPFGLQVQGKQVRVQVVNGKREIFVNEGDREVHFSDGDGKAIRVEVTKTVNGKKQTEKFEVKDEAELKQKHPDLAKLYAQHANVAQINVVMNGLQIVPGQGLKLGGGNAKGASEDIERALDKLKQLSERLEQLKAESTEEDRKALQDEIAAIRKELFAAQAKLE
ncbi:MAG: hypothetical protein KDA58_09725 [Planctomycetaceae bacterium]|nr:hypothetical protein [Planctomycetaceae bacterium]